MKKAAISGFIAVLCSGLGSGAFGACKRIYSNYTMTSNATTCFEIYGNNLVFNGNGYRLYGNTAEASPTVISASGGNVTVKNVDIDCNTKTTGIFFSYAGTASKVEGIRIRNCPYGIQKTETGLNVTGITDGGSNMINNSTDVSSSEPTSKHVYTSYLDGYSNGNGIAIYARYAPFSDYRSIFYIRNFAVLGYQNSFFYMSQTNAFLNTGYDLYINSVPTAYLSKVSFSSTRTILNINSTIVRDY